MTYTIPLTSDPSRLHPRKLAPLPAWDARLDVAWTETQRAAHLGYERGDSTVLMSAALVLALVRRVATLESRVEAREQMGRTE